MQRPVPGLRLTDARSGPATRPSFQLSSKSPCPQLCSFALAAACKPKASRHWSGWPRDKPAARPDIVPDMHQPSQHHPHHANRQGRRTCGQVHDGHMQGLIDGANRQGRRTWCQTRRRSYHDGTSANRQGRRHSARPIKLRVKSRLKCQPAGAPDMMLCPGNHLVNIGFFGWFPLGMSVFATSFTKSHRFLTKFMNLFM